jgi:hypothetical protein
MVPLVLAAAVTTLPLASAQAKVKCSHTTQYREWQCRYSPHPGQWSWQEIEVGRDELFCSGGTSQTGTVTECTSSTVSLCGTTSTTRCDPIPANECPRPTDPCEGHVPPADRRGWVLADGLSWIATPPAAHSYNSSGAQNEVHRVDEGQYLVRFPNLAGADGNIQVVAYGESNHRCKVTHWSGVPGKDGPGEVVAGVRCHRPNGTPVSTPFVVNFIATDDLWLPHAELAYTSFSPFQEETSPDFLWSTQGTLPVVTRVDTGYYTVRLEGHHHEDPSVIVTAMGGDPSFCQHLYTDVDAGGTTVGVFCFDGGGRLVDTAFTSRIEWREPPGLSLAGYLLADEPANPSYAPDTQYNATGATNMASRSATGRFSAVYPKLAGRTSILNEATDTVMVTARALGPLYCKVAKWSASEGDIVAETRCFNFAGDAADSSYDQVYLSYRPADVIGP